MLGGLTVPVGLAVSFYLLYVLKRKIALRPNQQEWFLDYGAKDERTLRELFSALHEHGLAEGCEMTSEARTSSRGVVLLIQEDKGAVIELGQKALAKGRKLLQIRVARQDPELAHAVVEVVSFCKGYFLANDLSGTASSDAPSEHPPSD